MGHLIWNDLGNFYEHGALSVSVILGFTVLALLITVWLFWQAKKQWHYKKWCFADDLKKERAKITELKKDIEAKANAIESALSASKRQLEENDCLINGGREQREKIRKFEEGEERLQQKIEEQESQLKVMDESIGVTTKSLREAEVKITEMHAENLVLANKMRQQEETIAHLQQKLENLKNIQGEAAWESHESQGQDGVMTRWEEETS